MILFNFLLVFAAHPPRMTKVILCDQSHTDGTRTKAIEFTRYPLQDVALMTIDDAQEPYWTFVLSIFNPDTDKKFKAVKSCAYIGYTNIKRPEKLRELTQLRGAKLKSINTQGTALRNQDNTLKFYGLPEYKSALDLCPRTSLARSDNTFWMNEEQTGIRDTIVDFLDLIELYMERINKTTKHLESYHAVIDLWSTLRTDRPGTIERRLESNWDMFWRISFYKWATERRQVETNLNILAHYLRKRLQDNMNMEDAQHRVFDWLEEGERMLVSENAAERTAFLRRIEPDCLEYLRHI